MFWILGSAFGFWEVFLDSGKCFGFWEVFWILGSVLDSGKCFVPMGHHTLATRLNLSPVHVPILFTKQQDDLSLIYYALRPQKNVWKPASSIR